MPTNTDLVKDLPADFDIFGQAVDDRIKALNPETTAGDISYRASTANAKSRLAIGTAGQVLAVNSGATAPEWKTLSSGGITLISETVASSLTSLSFSSIPGTYKQLLLRWAGIKRSSSDGTNFLFRMNNDSTDTNYILGQLRSNGVDMSTNLLNTNEASFNGGSIANTSLQNMSHGFLLIDNYASTSLYKNFNIQRCELTNTGTSQFYIQNNIWKDTSAITSIDIVRVSGTASFSNDTSTSIRLYGIS